MNLNIIRAIIFIIPGVLLVLFPAGVFQWQCNVLNSMSKFFGSKKRWNYKKLLKEKGKTAHIVMGVLFIIVAVVLFVIGFFIPAGAVFMFLIGLR